MRRKLIHIEIYVTFVEMIMNYLKDRKQNVIINTNISETLLVGDTSVSQGSVLSGTLYIIMTLDMVYQTHPIKHNTHNEYKECNSID